MSLQCFSLLPSSFSFLSLLFSSQVSVPLLEESDIRFIGNTYYQTKDVHTSAVKWTGGEILPADDQESLEKSIRMIDEDPKEIKFI